jgi:MFS family permease
MAGSRDRLDSLAPLRHPNFRWYFVASTAITAGGTMAGVALAFAVLSIDNSASALGLVLAAGTVPMVLFLLFGGVVADRLPLTLVLRVGMVVMGGTQGFAAALVITGTAEIWMLVVLEAVNGTVWALTFPAFTSITPRLVPPEQLQQANALQSFSRGALRILGPTISALLVVGVGPGWALAADAATWLVAAGVLGLVRLPPRPPRHEQTSTVAELREGWTYFRSTTWLWVVVLGFGFLNAIYTGAWFTLGPAQAKATIGEQGWGYVLSAESAGMMLTTLVMLRRPLRAPLLSGMLGISLLGLPIFVLGWSPQVGLLLICTFAAGAGAEVFGMGWNLAMQENVPEDMLSRAYSYDALGSYVAMPLGQLAFGPLGARYGEQAVLVASGVAYVVICLLVLSSRSVRGMRRLTKEPPLQEASPG